MVSSSKNSSTSEPYTSHDYRLPRLAAAFYWDTKPTIHLSQATAFSALASGLQNQLLAGISLSILLFPTRQGQHFLRARDGTRIPSQKLTHLKGNNRENGRRLSL